MTICASIANRCQHWWWWGWKWTSLNRSPVMGGIYSEVPCLGRLGWVLYSVVPCLEGDCTFGSNASWLMVTWDSNSPCEHTNMTENITFLQLCWRSAKIIILHYASFYCLFGTRRLNRIVHTWRSQCMSAAICITFSTLQSYFPRRWKSFQKYVVEAVGFGNNT